MLNADKFFVNALATDADITEVVEGRIFDPARSAEDETLDKIPYLVVMYEGGTSDGGTKDSTLSTLDACTVSILCVANDREGLADLTEMVNDAIVNAFEDDDFYDAHEDWNFYIEDAQMSAGAVEMDIEKPCCFQTLTYECQTTKR